MARPITEKSSRDHEALLARAWAILIQASFSAVKFIQKQRRFHKSRRWLPLCPAKNSLTHRKKCGILPSSDHEALGRIRPDLIRSHFGFGLNEATGGSVMLFLCLVV
jgi:hypothetical protein